MIFTEPQKAPRLVALSANNASCVTLTWSPPEWPNGDITGYEVSVNKTSFFKITQHQVNI